MSRQLKLRQKPDNLVVNLWYKLTQPGEVCPWGESQAGQGFRLNETTKWAPDKDFAGRVNTAAQAAPNLADTTWNGNDSHQNVD